MDIDKSTIESLVRQVLMEKLSGVSHNQCDYRGNEQYL